MTSSRKTQAVPSPEQLRLLRRASVRQRLELALTLSDHAAKQVREALRQNHPEVGEREVRLKFVELYYGRELAERARRSLAAPGSVAPGGVP